MVGIASVILFLHPAAVPLVDFVVSSDTTAEHLTFWNTAGLGPQPSEATLAATQASPAYQTYISQAAVDQRARDDAASAFATSPTAIGKSDRAAASLIVDEINILRQRDRDRSDDVAAATSLADLKIRWAARTALTDRTLAQAKTAWQNKISSGVAD